MARGVHWRGQLFAASPLFPPTSKETIVALTPNQLTNLRSIESGPGSIPTINATRLAAQGLIEKTGESSGARGYAHCRITDAGKAALIAA